MLNILKHSLVNGLRKTKRQISRIPIGARTAISLQKIIFRSIFRSQEALFTYYYNTNKWGNDESLSGPGSSLEATLSIRGEIEELIVALKIRKFLDASCGDFNWFRHIALQSGIEYIGGDIVRELVDLNNQQFGNSHIRFMHLDIANDEIPKADICLCRDTLFHFSNADIVKVLNGLTMSKIKYFLSTTYPGIDDNPDIMTGEFRPINLEKPPFKFPYHLVKYNDDSDTGHDGKRLGLWKIDENL